MVVERCAKDDNGVCGYLNYRPVVSSLLILGLVSPIDYLPLARLTRGLASEEEANFIPVD